MRRLSRLDLPRLALALGLGLAVLPLLQTRVLPFHDASGIVGLGGALVLRDDPAAMVRAFYDLDLRAYPSALYFGWALLAGAFGVSVEVGYGVFVALFCLCGPPLAVWFLLRAFGRPPALALLVFPVSYHHQIWYGFLGSSAAVTGLVLALAFARRLVDPPSGGSRIGDHAGLAFALLFVAAAHPFPLALTLAVIAPLLLAPPAPDQANGARRFWLHYGGRALALAPMAIFLASWAAGFFGRTGGRRSLWRTLRTTFSFETPALADGPRYLEWLGNGYLGAADEIVPALGVLTLALLLGFGVRAPASPAPAQRRDRWVLGWAAAVLLAGYLFLPMQLVWPELWWGVRVRCVLPSYLVLIALVRPRPRGLPLAALAPAFAAALIFFGYLTYDFRAHFRGRVLAGFDDAVAAIPPGRSVLGFPVRPDPHYTLAHPYLVQHYVARKGGRAVPQLKGHPGSYWITLKPPPDSPPWGDPRLFDWTLHSHWDYFLVERPLTPTEAVDPMRAAPPGTVARRYAGGQFEVWQRLQPE